MLIYLPRAVGPRKNRPKCFGGRASISYVFLFIHHGNRMTNETSLAQVGRNAQLLIFFVFGFVHLCVTHEYISRIFGLTVLSWFFRPTFISVMRP